MDQLFAVTMSPQGVPLRLYRGPIATGDRLSFTRLDFLKDLCV